MRLKPEQIEKLASLRDVWINHDQTQEILDEILNFYETNLHSETVSLMRLSGPTGSGKSTLISRMTASLDNPKDVLYVTVPEECTKKNLVLNILTALGDPKAGRGSRGDMEARLPRFIRHLGIKLIVLDEFQHLVSRHTHKIYYEVADWVKAEAERLGVPILMVGLPEIEEVLIANPQVDRRTYHKCDIEPFSFETRENAEAFASFLRLVDRELPFAGKSSLTDIQVMQAVMHATGGCVGYIMRLIISATELAMLDGAEDLERQHLERAFEALRERDQSPLNPFNPNVNQKRLQHQRGQNTNIRGRRKNSDDGIDRSGMPL